MNINTVLDGILGGVLEGGADHNLLHFGTALLNEVRDRLDVALELKSN